jgi:hypothetical protein
MAFRLTRTAVVKAKQKSPTLDALTDFQASTWL